MPGSDLDLSDLSVVLRPVEDPQYDGVDMTPQDWFILSRVDGSTELKGLLALSPAPPAETIESLRRLIAAGLLAVPVSVDAVPEPTPSRSHALPTPPQGWPADFASFVFDDPDDTCELDPALRKLVAYFDEHLELVTYYHLFGVSQTASDADVRRSYFRWSKVFHPDKFFRQDMGTFGERITRVFRWLNQGHKVLGDTQRRSEYDALLATGVVGPWALPQELEPPVHKPEPRAQPSVLRPRRPLAELLHDGKQLERVGSFLEAWELYEQALKQRRSPELMNRCAECLIRVRQHLDVAEVRARAATAAAPDHARYWVALAYVLELRDKPTEALSCYESALAVNPEHEGAKQRMARLRART